MAELQKVSRYDFDSMSGNFLKVRFVHILLQYVSNGTIVCVQF